MELRELSKLQIRAEVLPMIQKMTSLDEISKAEQDSNIAQLKSIKNKEYIIELLLKEFINANHETGQAISFLLIEIGDAETLKEPLWQCIKNPKINDEIKDLAGIILRSIGENCEPEAFLTYFQDPKTIVDKETKKLLETAQINPEAQIDFLDFLFSLPEGEQINLIDSLKEDFPGEYLANLLIPALEYQPQQIIQEIIIKTLGESRTIYAVPALNDIIKYSNNEILKKLAIKNLNVLKFAGIDIENNSKIQLGSQIANISKFYKCCVSTIDGNGNQGIIFSRIKSNNDIIMFSVVVNDVTGIIDCFGFNGISIEDLNRIINRFSDDLNTINVPAEYCKYKLENAEKVNKENNLPISYEYSSWKSLICDITMPDITPENQALSWVNPELNSQALILLAHPNFKHWFFEKNDNPEVENMINSIIERFSENTNSLINSPEEIISITNTIISEYADKIFDKNTINIYVNRLLDSAYLFNEEGLLCYRDMAATITNDIQNKSPKECAFTKEILYKSIYEALINIKHNIQNRKNNATIWITKNNNADSKQTETGLSEAHLDVIINILLKNELS